MLNLPSKPGTNPAIPNNRETVATFTLFRYRATELRVNSDVRLKLQLSCASVDPSGNCVLSAVSSMSGTDVVSTGGGSYHVTLTPSEIEN